MQKHKEGLIGLINKKSKLIDFFRNGYYRYTKYLFDKVDDNN